MANRDRDLMVDVGPAMRATIDRAVAAGITGRQWRVLGALLWWTASYSRLVDDVTHEQIAEHAGIDITTKSWRKTVARELRALAAVIEQLIELPADDAYALGRHVAELCNAGTTILAGWFNWLIDDRFGDTARPHAWQGMYDHRRESA